MESCCFRSGVKASAVTPQTKVEPGFIFHQFFRVLAGSCVFVFKAWRVCEKQPKAKSSGCLLPSSLKRSRHSASDQLCLSGLHSLTHRDSDLQEEVPSSKACFPKHGTGFPETLQWDDNNFPSLSRVHSPSRCPIMQKKMQVEIWPMTKNKLQYFLLGGYSVFCLLADSANMAEPQTDDSPRRRQTHTSASCPWTFLCVRIRSFVSSIHQNLGRCL